MFAFILFLHSLRNQKEESIFNQVDGMVNFCFLFTASRVLFLKHTEIFDLLKIIFLDVIPVQIVVPYFHSGFLQ